MIIMMDEDEIKERAAIEVEHIQPDAEAHRRWMAKIEAIKIVTAIKQRKQPTTPRRTK